MGKYLKLFITLLFAFLVNFDLVAGPFTINKTVQQPTCGSNGLLSISLTPPPASGAKFLVYKDGVFLVQISGNLANLNSLAPGVYKVVVIDNTDGYTDSVDNIVLDPAANALSATHYIDSPTCDTSTNGRLALTLRNAAHPVTYKWSKENNPFANNDSVVNPALKGKYAVTITDNNNCRFEMADMEVVEKAGKMVAIDTIIVPTSCDSPNGSVQVIVSGGNDPVWVWQNRKTTDSIDDQKLDSLPAGKYTVIYTDTLLKCYPLIIRDLEVKQNSRPTVVATGTDTLCPFPSVDVGWVKATVTEGDTTDLQYLWSTSSTKDSVGGVSAGTYTVTVVDRAGCKDTAEWTIQDYPKKDIRIVPEYREVLKLTSQFLRIDDPIGLYDIVWSSVPADKYDILSNKDSVIRSNGMTENTVYSISAKYGPGCITKDNLTIRIIERDDVIKDENIPNIITPGQIQNFRYRLINLDNNGGSTKLFSTFEYKIYDRWGNLVFQANDENFEWLGTDLNGELLTNGVYTYLMKYRSIGSNEEKIRTGNILLEK